MDKLEKIGNYDEMLSEFTRLRKELKVLSGWTVADICDYLGISTSLLQCWECGIRNASIPMLFYCNEYLKRKIQEHQQYKRTNYLYVIHIFKGDEIESYSYISQKQATAMVKELGRKADGIALQSIFLGSSQAPSYIYFKSKEGTLSSLFATSNIKVVRSNAVLTEAIIREKVETEIPTPNPNLNPLMLNLFEEW